MSFICPIKLHICGTGICSEIFEAQIDWDFKTFKEKISASYGLAPPFFDISRKGKIFNENDSLRDYVNKDINDLDIIIKPIPSSSYSNFSKNKFSIALFSAALEKLNVEESPFKNSVNTFVQTIKQNIPPSVVEKIEETPLLTFGDPVSPQEKEKIQRVCQMDFLSTEIQGNLQRILNATYETDNLKGINSEIFEYLHANPSPISNAEYLIDHIQKYILEPTLRMFCETEDFGPISLILRKKIQEVRSQMKIVGDMWKARLSENNVEINANFAKYLFQFDSLAQEIHRFIDSLSVFKSDNSNFQAISSIQANGKNSLLDEEKRVEHFQQTAKTKIEALQSFRDALSKQVSDIKQRYESSLEGLKKEEHDLDLRVQIVCKMLIACCHEIAHIFQEIFTNKDLQAQNTQAIQTLNSNSKKLMDDLDIQERSWKESLEKLNQFQTNLQTYSKTCFQTAVSFLERENNARKELYFNHLKRELVSFYGDWRNFFNDLKKMQSLMDNILSNINDEIQSLKRRASMMMTKDAIQQNQEAIEMMVQQVSIVTNKQNEFKKEEEKLELEYVKFANLLAFVSKNEIPNENESRITQENFKETTILLSLEGTTIKIKYPSNK